MRWFINSVLLASIAIISASKDSVRPKRDISLIKDILWTKVFGSEQEGSETSTSPSLNINPEDVRIFRIPGFDNILVKAVPKVTQGVEVEIPSKNDVKIVESVDIHPSIAILSSYLGTKTLNETFHALNGMTNLLQSGVLNGQTQRYTSIENYGLPPLVSPVLVESDKIVVETDEIRRPVHAFPFLQDGVVPIRLPHPPMVSIKPTQIAFPDLPLPTKYSYKQVHGNGVMSYTAEDNQNVIVTESKKPIPLPPYISQRFKEILALCDNPSIIPAALPVPILPATVNNVPLFYEHRNFPMHQIKEAKPSHAADGYSYQHIHSDGVMTAYSGSGQVEKVKNGQPVVNVQEAPRPLPLPIFISNRIENAAATASAIKPAVIKETFYGPPIPVRQEPYPIIVENIPSFNAPVLNEEAYFGTHGHSWGQQSNNKVPTGFSYQTVHKDGSVTVHSNLGSFTENKRTGDHPSTTNIESKLKPDFIPGYLSNRVQFNGAIKPAVVKETFYGPPIPVQTAPYPIIVEQMPEPIPIQLPVNPAFKEEVYTGALGHIWGQQSNNKVPTNSYSYQTLHKDGSVTFFSDLGSTTNSKKIKEADGVRIETNRTSTINDGSKVGENNDGQQISHEIIAKEPKPLHFPSFPSNTAAGNVIKPSIIKETFYGPPIPINVEPVSGNFQLPVRQGAHAQSWVHYSGNNVSPNGYSYHIVHGDSDSTNSGLVTNSKKTGEVAKSKNTGCDDDRKNKTNNNQAVPCELKPSGFSFSTIHKDGSVTSYSNTGIAQNKQNKDEKNNLSTVSTKPTSVSEKASENVNKRILFNEPVVSQYMYKQINHHQPDQFQSVNIENASVLDGHVNVVVGGKLDKVTAFPYISHTTTSQSDSQIGEVFKVPSDYVYIPPMPTITPTTAGTDSNSSFSQITNRIVYTNNASAVASEASSVKTSANSATVSKAVPHENSSSDDSLSANPIVVLPEENTFSYTQNKIDGSSLTVLGNKNTVSVLEESKTENKEQRGDIPENMF